MNQVKTPSGIFLLGALGIALLVLSSPVVAQDTVAQVTIAVGVEVLPPTTEVPQEPPPSLDIQVEPASFSFGGQVMDVPGSYEAPVTVTVQAQGIKEWFLKAEDTTPGSPSKGFLYSFLPARNLSSPLRIWDFTLATPGFRDLGTGNTVFYSSQKPGKTTVDAQFRQDATTKDRSGTYTLNVTFTATTS